MRGERRMFGGCLEDVWRMFGGCLEDVWRMWGECGEDVGRMWGGCGEVLLCDRLDRLKFVFLVHPAVVFYLRLATG
jgi:hypothetical protein